MKKIFGLCLLLALAFTISACGAKKSVPATTNSTQETATTNEVPATTPVVDETAMVDCGVGQDPTCFMNRMNGCLPVTIQMMGSDNATKIEMTILGVENEKCHFQRKINDVLDLNCFFPKGTMNSDTLDQTFGNDKGLQKVVDDACKSGW
jgi:predicted small lipoprotein YifL